MINCKNCQKTSCAKQVAKQKTIVLFCSAYKARGQAEQEPVGKFAKFTDGIWREVTDGSAGVPLYNTPPPPEQKPMHPEIKKMYEDYFDRCFRESSAAQRTWVGLTDDEILDVNMSTVTKVIDDPIVCDTDHNIIQLGKAIEAKLKEKNT
jgi:hypothetical protein